MSRQANSWEKGIAIGALVVVTSFYAYVIYSIPAYQELFRDFETGLPIITQFVFATYFYWSTSFVVLGAVGATLILLRRDRRGWFFLVPASISIVVTLPIAVWAMYAPIFEAGSAT